MTVASTIGEASELVENGKARQFDVVLTDLFMPFTQEERRTVFHSFTGSSREIPEQLPIGLVFALCATNAGVPVALCTDSDHHENHICTLLDMLSIRPVNAQFFGQKEKVPVTYVEARNVPMQARWDAESKTFTPTEEWVFDQPIIKDWQKVLKKAQIVPTTLEEQLA